MTISLISNSWGPNDWFKRYMVDVQCFPFSIYIFLFPFFSFLMNYVCVTFQIKRRMFHGQMDLPGRVGQSGIFFLFFVSISGDTKITWKYHEHQINWSKVHIETDHLIVERWTWKSLPSQNKESLYIEVYLLFEFVFHVFEKGIYWNPLVSLDFCLVFLQKHT